ncbi:prealbumin-like fold domain-containing protein [Holdemanella biformis]
MGQTFECKNGKYINISQGKDTDHPENKIVTKNLNGDGIFASWAFKVNYGGDLKGDYRVLETIPDGMELSYIRIKWTGKSAKDITSKQITNLGDDWKENTIIAPDDDNSNITTYYYVNGNQALIQLGEFKGIHARDDYSVDVQVVCRVTDPDVLLGGETKTFNNKVMLQSPDGTKDYVSANADAEISNIKVLHKAHIHKENSPKIDYTITANEFGQTLLKSATDKLTLVDKMSPNLVLDPDSIKAKNIKNDSDVSIETRYDPEKNILEIKIPDGTPVKITYTCKVKVAPDTETQVSNNVYWKNYSQKGGVNDGIEKFSYDLNASGTIGIEAHPQLKIVKRDNTLKPLSGAEFEIHKCKLENKEIKHTSKNPITVTSGADGTVIIPTDKFPMDFNTIYEVKETNTVDGYILDDTPYYIMRAKKEDSDKDYSDYVKEYIKIAYQNSEDKHYIVAYDKDYFLVEIYNAQEGITVKKQFTNNAAETEHKPISGTYRFGLYANVDGTGDPLDTIDIKYGPNDTDVKSAKFKNPDDLDGTYYVFELDKNGNPIQASATEATINSMQYKVVYESNSETTNIANAAKVGNTVTVTNKSRTKILPSTGGTGNLIYRMSGTALVAVGVISLSIIDKKKRKKKVGESNEIN